MHLRLALNLAIVWVNPSFQTAFSTYPYKYASLNYAFLRGAFRHLSLSLSLSLYATKIEYRFIHKKTKKKKTKRWSIAFILSLSLSH